MNILKSAALAAAALFALAACQKPVDVAAVEDEVKRGVRDWIAAFNAGDVDTIVAKYADEAIVMAPGHPAAIGHEAIRAVIAAESGSAKSAGMTLVINDGDTVGVSGDIAWHSGSYSVSDAGGATADSGNYMEVLQNFEGKWLIIRDIWNSDRPPPAPQENENGDAT